MFSSLKRSGYQRLSIIRRLPGCVAFASLPLLAAMANGAMAQTTGAVTFSNPPAIAKPMGYTHVVEVAGPHRTVYISGQLGLGRDGKLVGAPGDFRAQARQAFENLKAALDSVGGRFEHIVKINMYLTDMEGQLPVLREVRDSYVNTAAPPASTTVQISRLALPDALFEIEAIVILPPHR